MVSPEDRDPRITNRYGRDNMLDMLTQRELWQDAQYMASEALGQVQAAQTDRALYNLLLDLVYVLDEIERRDPQRYAATEQEWAAEIAMMD